MPSEKISQRLYYLALYLTAFVIPFPFIFAPIAIMLLSVCWILNFNLQQALLDLKERRGIWLWIIFYILHAVSYFYTYDKGIALNDLQTKLSFIVLPVIIGLGLPLDLKKMEQTFSAFIAGLFIMAVYFLVHGFYTWHKTANTDVFFYHNLIYGVGANAVYYALYTFLGLTLLLLFPWSVTWLKKKQVFFATLLVLLVFFFLLSSKLMILVFFITVFPVYIRSILKTKKIIGYLYIAAGLLLIGLIFFTKNPINRRYQDILENTNKSEWLPQYANGQKQHFNNLTLRLFLWETAIQNIKENNLWWKGCGDGSIEMLQKKKISEYGNSNDLQKLDPPLWKYNIHNMYLQSLMMLGVPGLVIFLSILLLPFFLIKNMKHKIAYILAIFNISILLFMFQESALQTQAGVVFYIFFFTVFYNYAFSVVADVPQVIIPDYNICMGKGKRKVIPIALIAATIVVAYWQISTSTHFLLWDSLNAAYPFRFYAVECIRNGYLPLWLPYQFTGYPFYADPQSGCWYPVTWIFAALGRYNLNSLNIEYILSIFTGGYGMYHLAKVWVKDNAAALLAGLCYCCCGVFVGNAEHFTWVISSAWLPWLFWSYYQMVSRLEVRYAALIALLVYLMATGGYPAFLIISLYLIIILLIVLLFDASFRKNWRKLIFLHTVLLVLSFGCCSILIYSFSKGIQASTRSGGVSLEQALVYPFSPACFTSFLLPYASFKSFDLFKIDVTMTNGYFGLTGFLFFILSLFQRKDKKFWLILALSLLCLLAGVGGALPFRAFLYKWLPLMNLFRFPSVFRIFFIIGFLLLAATAFRNFKNEFKKWKKATVFIIISLLVFYLAALIYSLQDPQTLQIDWHNLIYQYTYKLHATFLQNVFIQSCIQMLLLIILLAGIIFRMKNRINVKMIFAICLVDLIVSVQLNMYGTISYPNMLEKTRENIANCPKGFPIPENKGPVNQYYDSKFWWDLSPVAGNTLVFEKVLGIDGYDPFTLQRFDQLGKSKIKDSVWQNPPAYFANNMDVAYNDDNSILKNKNDVLLNSDDLNKMKGRVFPVSASDSVYFTSFGPNKMTLHTEAQSNRLLVLLQNNVQDWKVKIDGKNTEWVNADIAYMGVYVPSGVHRIEFEFSPPHVLELWILTAGFLLICIFIIICQRLRTKTATSL